MTTAASNLGGNGTCWSTEYCLRNCEGYRVFDAAGELGYVEEVTLSPEGELETLTVRDGGRPLTLRPEQIVEIEPHAEALRVREVAVSSEQIAELLLRGERQGWLSGDEVEKLAHGLPAVPREALVSRVASHGIEMRLPAGARAASTPTGA